MHLTLALGGHICDSAGVVHPSTYAVPLSL